MTTQTTKTVLATLVLRTKEAGIVGTYKYLSRVFVPR